MKLTAAHLTTLTIGDVKYHPTFYPPCPSDFNLRNIIIDPILKFFSGRFSPSRHIKLIKHKVYWIAW